MLKVEKGKGLDWKFLAHNVKKSWGRRHVHQGGRGSCRQGKVTQFVRGLFGKGKRGSGGKNDRFEQFFLVGKKKNESN